MSGRPRDPALWAMIGIALLLRLGVALWPVFHHPDELWQYLEPARHLTGRDWVQTWEYRGGARSWLLPVVFAGPMALGNALAPNSFFGVILPRLICICVSLGTIIGAAGFGFRLSRLHGLIAAFVACFWYELVYFAPRTLSEPIATALILVACWLLFASERKRPIMVGVLLGLACLIRIQYAPAAVVLAVWGLRLDWRAWLRFALGGAAALLVSGLADLIAGATPFEWVLRYFSANIIAGRAAGYGTSPAHGYLQLIAGLWGWAAIPIVLLALVGARRYPALFAAALVNVAVHSAIAHKEYRFILLSTAIFVVLAAIGSVDLASKWRGLRRPALLLGGAWLVLSLACGALGSSTREWGQNGKLVKAWRIASAVPGLCAAAVYRVPARLVASYTLLDRDVPIYQFDERNAAAARRSRAFNVVFAPESVSRDFLGYRSLGCGDGKRQNCVYTRPGGCTVSAQDDAFLVNRVLVQNDY